MSKAVITAAVLAVVGLTVLPATALGLPIHGQAQMSAGALPFSGLDAAFALGAGLLLAFLGLALGQARVSRPVPRPACTPATSAMAAEPAAARR